MGDIVVDGMTRVAWVTTISTVTAPTTSELNAGILLQTYITADGLEGFEPSTEQLDATTFGSGWAVTRLGLDSLPNLLLRLKRRSGTDTVFTTLVRGAAGYVVVRRDLAEGTAWLSGQSVDVHPVICARRRPLKPEANTVSRYEVPLCLSGTPALPGTIP